MVIGDSGEIMKNCNFIDINKNYRLIAAVLALVCGVLFFNQHQGIDAVSMDKHIIVATPCCLLYI